MSQDRNGASIEESVAELEATVDGLTEELVDAKERIKELEVAAGLREGDEDETLDEDMTVEELFEAADDDPIADDDEEETSESDQEVLGDDIIVG